MTAVGLMSIERLRRGKQRPTVFEKDAGLGALNGGIASGGKGALAAGAATGAIVSASGEQHLKIPSETRLEFKLESALKVN